MLQEFCAVNTLSPSIAGALPHGEPLDACVFSGMDFARRPRCKQHCNTKAKLAIKRCDKNLTEVIYMKKLIVLIGSLSPVGVFFYG